MLFVASKRVAAEALFELRVASLAARGGEKELKDFAKEMTS